MREVSCSLWKAVLFGLGMNESKRAFVTGGGGYIGNCLCEALTARGYAVTAFDAHYLEREHHSDSIHRVKGDLRDLEAVRSALNQSKADVVFHIASYGTSGREMLNTEMMEAVNITGTKNIIEGRTVGRANPLLRGQEIRNGDQSLPYLPLDKYVDHYSRTKSLVEQEVLSANGRVVRGGGERLKTCALRCAEIYGEGEQRHLPRIVMYIERGIFKFTYGARDSLVEFLHADNFCQAHIKAAEACTLPESPVPGQAYFISDGKPINNFQFFKPLVEGLGYSYPWIRLPLSMVYFIAFLTELVHSFVARYIYNFQPFLTRAEILKTGVTHYFSMAAAGQDFGYTPEPRTLEGVVKWFRERGHGRRRKGTQRSSWLTSIVIYSLVLVALIFVIMGFLPVVR